MGPPRVFINDTHTHMISRPGDPIKYASCLGLARYHPAIIVCAAPHAYMKGDNENPISALFAHLRKFGMTVTDDHVSMSIESQHDAVLENVRVGHDTGLKSVMLVFSNFITLAFVFVAIQKAKNSATRERRGCLYFVSTLMLFGMLISIFYHTCQSTGVCIGVPFEQWQINDHFTANLSVVSAILLVITIDDLLFYASAGVAYIIVSVLLVSSDPLSVLPTIQIVGLGSILGLVKHLLVDQGKITGSHKRFSIGWLIAGFVTAVAGSAFYMFDSGSNYFWAHSSWHVSSSTSALFIVLGCTADTPIYSPRHIHVQ